jgi:hypothetical protein
MNCITYYKYWLAMACLMQKSARQQPNETRRGVT